ncbi:ASCH domain-containing protein [Herbiconiux daphne]|uniref:ASCH domain-containing protein n=1 Tax=Herbiconiux daphne TaxID=2970914 RepID=A0ABT2H041_9MICO|nr:ASCH domain-containing protein [Herbiconiux daphne]MCS5732494.1 ASCH domain-containing protein [Herbiconiux daphne]
MGGAATKRIALMAIHQKWADAIMNGDKRVEFRKRRLADDIRTVWVYATAPTSKVIGKFTVGEIVTGSPASIWARFGDIGEINHDDFFAYYGDAHTAVAIVVSEAERFADALALAEIDPKPAVPQSFAYLSVPS